MRNKPPTNIEILQHAADNGGEHSAVINALIAEHMLLRQIVERKIELRRAVERKIRVEAECCAPAQPAGVPPNPAP